jgi:hypothetical protein
MAYVYRHIRLDKNEPFYIGIGDTEKRAYIKSNRNEYWKRISKKGYEVEILFTNLTWDEACKKEKEFISLYGRSNNNTGILCNLTDGGDGSVGRKPWNFGKKTSQEQINKLVENHKGMSGRKHSEETKSKIAEKAKSRVGSRIGMKASEETKLKMRNAQLGKKISFETRTKISTKLKEKPKVVCPYCNKEGSEAVMPRYHFDNCKLKK